MAFLLLSLLSILSWTILSKSSLLSHLFLTDGKYCLLDQKSVVSCQLSISLHTRTPYIIFRIEDEKRVREPPSIHVEKMLPQSTNHTSLVKIQFIVNNLSHPLFQQHSSFVFTVQRDGILDAQPRLVSNQNEAARPFLFKKVSNQQLCQSSNLLPGLWRYDPHHLVTEENKWENCPSLQFSYFPRPTPYYASEFYPESNCLILPVRVSLTLLLRHLKKEGSLPYHHKHQASNYIQFFGDSFSRQVVFSGLCESQSDEFAVFRPSLIWNRYFRNDLPCAPSCLVDPNYLAGEGATYQRFEGAPTPCSGCPDGKKRFDSAMGHSELFSQLFDIPASTRVLVINGGTWFTRDWYVENNTEVFKDAVRAFIPELAKLQKQRNYALDIYFITLPAVDPSLSLRNSFEWDTFEERNRFLYDVLSDKALAVHNLTVTILPNDKLFRRKNMSEERNVFSPDNFHYSSISVFSPPTFLFQLIVHHHVNKVLKAKS